MCDPVEEAWTEADDVIEEVREVRRQISAQFDDDPVKLGEYLMESQKRHGDRLVDPGAMRKRNSAAWCHCCWTPGPEIRDAAGAAGGPDV